MTGGGQQKIGWGDEATTQRHVANSTHETEPNQTQTVDTTQGTTTDPDQTALEGSLDLGQTDAGAVDETIRHPCHEDGRGHGRDRAPSHSTDTPEGLTDKAETTSSSPPLSKGSRR
jgi:hypothetical protein